jgi:hypothetical protein
VPQSDWAEELEPAPQSDWSEELEPTPEPDWSEELEPEARFLLRKQLSIQRIGQKITEVSLIIPLYELVKICQQHSTDKIKNEVLK